MTHQMLKTACAIFVLMSFVGGLFAMLAFSFQKIDRIRKGRPRLFQKPSFRMLIVWMIMFGIFGAYYFSKSKLFGPDLTAAYTWYGVSMMLMPLAALMGSGLVRLSMADKIKNIVRVYEQVEAKEKTKKGAAKGKKKGKGKAGEDEQYKDYETLSDKDEKFEDDPDLYKLGKDKDKEEYFKDYM
ncbi:MAG: hypothetical protein RIB59_09555 [Rhodospirillales bacterium]